VLEELLLKDHENIPFLDDSPSAPREPQAFAPEEMVPCEKCLRSNPPTRANCLYCAAALSTSEKESKLRLVDLSPIDSSAAGYNSILLPKPGTDLPANAVAVAAGILKINSTDLQRIIASGLPLPVARTATRAEADLVKRTLVNLGFDVIVISDLESGLMESATHLRAAEISEAGITLNQRGGGDGIWVSWEQIVLLVSGRLITRRVESSERKGKRGEKEVLEATELFADELVLDLFVEDRSGNFRVASNNFDFSCLTGKKMIAAENFSLLKSLIRNQAPNAEYDDSYLAIRSALTSVWPSEQHTGSLGWRRDRPGKYSVGAVTQSSNENQFTRYSRLRHFLMKTARVKS
jgi:hypothetical protein